MHAGVQASNPGQPRVECKLARNVAKNIKILRSEALSLFDVGSSASRSELMAIKKFDARHVTDSALLTFVDALAMIDWCQGERERREAELAERPISGEVHSGG